MDNLAQLAARKLEVPESQIVDSHLYKDAGELVVLVDYGIGGVKKLRLSLDDLHALQEQAEAEEFVEKAIENQEPLEDLTVAKLQEIAREINLEGYTTMRKAELVEALAARLEAE